MTKATDKLLGALHGKLAKSMMTSLESSEEASMLLENFEDELPEAVAKFLRKTSDASPSLLTAISKFLKDNDITCAIEDNAEMSELEERLEKKRKRIGNVIPIQE